MDYIIALIFGLVQGITEFLPISSSGHLVILHSFFALPVRSELLFDVTLHLATLLAIIIFFRKDVAGLAAAWLRTLGGKGSREGRMAWLIILATIPAGLAGWLAEDMIEEKLRSPLTVIIMLAAVGILFLIAEKYGRRTDEMDRLNQSKSLLIGFAQALALIPGTSRSGITIAAGLAAGLKRTAALKFSFLLSVPIIAGASAKNLFSLFASGPDSGEITVIGAAFLAAFFSGYFAIKYFMRFAENHTLNIFAVYRFILAVILAVYFYL